MFTESLQAIQDYLRRIYTSEPLLTVVVELLLIGLVVWWVVRFLRGTRGARLFKGALFLLAVAYLIINLVAKRLEWNRIELLFSKLMWPSFIAVVIVFQPELRRVLMHVGQTRFFWGPVDETQDVISHIVRAATSFSKNKIGAVMAVEGEVKLGSLAESGVRLNARVSTELLTSIFWPGSTLHDMGVIIRGDHVLAARCQFPLAEMDERTSSLGSRHRAALGLSSESDAAVVVVSEQTGRISLALSGSLEQGLSAHELQNRLAEHLRLSA
ncbi:MAG: diadenylate cyclase CdaA [Phycisphaerae bacterium]|nr:diadenylate cyclase CdaA [Phycisphaerae bacterium]